MRNTEMLNCATINVLRSMLLPPVKEKPFFSTPIIWVPDKTNAGYTPAKKLTIKENKIKAITGAGCNKTAAVKCLPVTVLK